jgi:hypothetical protein
LSQNQLPIILRYYAKLIFVAVQTQNLSDQTQKKIKKSKVHLTKPKKNHPKILCCCANPKFIQPNPKNNHPRPKLATQFVSRDPKSTKNH